MCIRDSVITYSELDGILKIGSHSHQPKRQWRPACQMVILSEIRCCWNTGWLLSYDRDSVSNLGQMLRYLLWWDRRGLWQQKRQKIPEVQRKRGSLSQDQERIPENHADCVYRECGHKALCVAVSHVVFELKSPAPIVGREWSTRTSHSSSGRARSFGREIRGDETKVPRTRLPPLSVCEEWPEGGKLTVGSTHVN